MITRLLWHGRVCTLKYRPCSVNRLGYYCFEIRSRRIVKQMRRKTEKKGEITYRRPSRTVATYKDTSKETHGRSFASSRNSIVFVSRRGPKGKQEDVIRGVCDEITRGWKWRKREEDELLPVSVGQSYANVTDVNIRLCYGLAHGSDEGRSHEERTKRRR